MSLHTRVVRAEPHTEIGLAIERDAELLVERWCGRAVEEQPTAKRVHFDVLRNGLAAFLQEMGRGLRQAGDDDSQPHRVPALEHGEQRWDNGWSLTELIKDYQILQLVIIDHLEQTLDRPLHYREFMAVGVFIDDAVSAGIAAFVANRDEHIHRVERERNEALEEVNRRKDEFMAMLGHELRNPLAPIQNSVNTLQLLCGERQPAVLNAIGVLERQTKQIVRLVDDLMDLARIGQGRFELRKAQANLAEVIEQAVQMSEATLKLREHTLTVNCPTEPIYLEADPQRLAQVVVNLLNNAAKFTERGGQVRLSVERDDDSAIIRVSDNGIGIPPEMMARVFDLFMQVAGSNPRSEGGLGIGLALVQRLVELHGGNVTCQSDGVGKGSEFVVRLPATNLREAPVQPAPPLIEPEDMTLHNLLLVEDHSDSREALSTLLSLKGYHVDAVGDGASAIEAAVAHPPDAVLVDIGLPDMDGHEVAERLRTRLGKQVLLVALTGYSRTEDFKRALDAGFDSYLVKPVDIHELRRVLTRVSSP